MTTARVALDAHTELHEMLKHPPDALARFFDHYMTEGGKVVAEQRRACYEGIPAGERTLLESWEHYTWPAQTGPEMIRLLAGPLFSAPTYQVTAEIVHAVTAMYRATADSAPVLRASETPSAAGFAYLDEPVALTDALGAETSVHALSWGPQLFSPEGLRPAKGVRVSSWDLGAYRRGKYPGDSSTVFIPYGEPIAPERVSDDVTRWLHCLWLFMGTEIVTSARTEADRAAKRRAVRSGRPRSDVTVILLRRGSHGGAEGHRDIDWSCRWIVQAHARHLEDYRALGYEHHHARVDRQGGPCLVCGTRTTHIGAYIKGPGGKPLKSAERVFRVTR